MEEISRRTIAKYLGYRGKPLDESTTALVEAALSELNAVSPRHVLRRLPLFITENKVTIESFQVVSRSLAGHLAGCGKRFCWRPLWAYRRISSLRGLPLPA